MKKRLEGKILLIDDPQCWTLVFSLGHVGALEATSMVTMDRKSTCILRSSTRKRSGYEIVSMSP